MIEQPPKKINKGETLGSFNVEPQGTQTKEEMSKLKRMENFEHTGNVNYLTEGDILEMSLAPGDLSDTKNADTLGQENTPEKKSVSEGSPSSLKPEKYDKEKLVEGKEESLKFLDSILDEYWGEVIPLRLLKEIELKNMIYLLKNSEISFEDKKWLVFHISMSPWDWPEETNSNSEILVNSIDLENWEYNQSAAYLEVLRYFNGVIENGSGEFEGIGELFNNEMPQKIKDKFGQNRELNYLLGVRLKGIIEVSMDKYLRVEDAVDEYNKEKIDPDTDFPYLVAKGTYAWKNDSGETLVYKPVEEEAGLLSDLNNFSELSKKRVYLSDEVSREKWVFLRKMVDKYNFYFKSNLDELLDLARIVTQENTDEDFLVYHEELKKILKEHGEEIISLYNESTAAVKSDELDLLNTEAKEAWTGLYSERDIEDPIAHLKSLCVNPIKKEDFGFGDFSDSDIESYKNLNSYWVRDILNEEFSIEVEELSQAEQIYFLGFLQKQTVESVQDLKDFCLKFKNIGAVSFLSFQQGGEKMGEHILAIGKNYSQEEATSVFGKYAEIVDIAEKAEEFLKVEFDNPDKELANKISQGLLNKGKRLLESFAEDRELGPEEVLKELEKYRAENVLLVEKYKALKQSGLIESIEDLQNISESSYSSQEVLQDENLLGKLESLYKQNYENYSKDGLASLVDEFRKNMEAGGSKVFALENGDEMLSFLLVNENAEKNDVYISALNVDPRLKETAAGRSVLESTIYKYLRENWTVSAEASPDNAQAYINQYEFVGYERTEDDDEDYILKIKKDPKKTYVSQDKKVYNKKKIKEMVEQGSFEIDGEEMAIFISNDSRETPPQLDSGYVITQMFRGKMDEQAGNYFLLEKVK